MTVVVKIGGSVLEPAPQPEMMAALGRVVAGGHELILVHGGGKALSALLGALGVASEFHQGLRVTSPEVLRAARMAFAGEVNTALVAALLQAGVRAVGLTGGDGGCVSARATRPELGRVGTQVGADPRLPSVLAGAGFTPVIASLASDGAGGLLNVNADQMAAAVAAAVGAEALFFITDVAGVLDAEGCTLARVTLGELAAMASGGTIHGGMLPKSDACRAALTGGVARVQILGVPAALQLDALLEDRAAAGTGTRVLAD